jgi:hypothetical protein
MTLISNGRIVAGLLDRRQMNESKLTLALVRHGFAEWGESEQKSLETPGAAPTAPAAKSVPAGESAAEATVSQTPAQPSSGRLSARARDEASRAKSQSPMPERRDHAKTELLKVRLSPEEKAELEALTTRTTLSRFVRNLIREARETEGD